MLKIQRVLRRLLEELSINRSHKMMLPKKELLDGGIRLRPCEVRRVRTGATNNLNNKEVIIASSGPSASLLTTSPNSAVCCGIRTSAYNFRAQINRSLVAYIILTPIDLYEFKSRPSTRPPFLL